MNDNQYLKDAWTALDHLTGVLPLYEYFALERCVREVQESADAAERIRPKVEARIAAIEDNGRVAAGLEPISEDDQPPA